LANGTYNLSAEADSPGFSTGLALLNFTVNGLAETVSVVFVPSFSLTFFESGLPTYQGWTVTVHAMGSEASMSAVGATISIVVPAGNYTFAISTIGYNVSPAGGNGTLTSPSTVSVQFAPSRAPPGFITGVVTVGSAQLYLNGLPFLIGFGGGFYFPLAPGSYTVIIVASGYVPYYNSTYLASNETVRMIVNLQAVGGAPAIPPAPSSPGTATWVAIALLSAGTVGFGAGMIRYVRGFRSASAELARLKADRPEAPSPEIK
jgi:hypothetical protein